MKRALVFLAVLWALALVADAKAAPPVIYVVNHSSLSNETLNDALPVFQQAVDNDFGPAWNAYATLSTDSAPPGSWVVELKDYTDAHGAAGYHRILQGVPYAQVGVLSGLSWQLVFSHELFEMLADPYIDRAAYIRKCTFWDCSTKAFYLIEVGDPVEYWWYTRLSPSGWPVIVTDFVTENWFSCQAGKMDFLGRLKRCHTLAPGGYLYIYDGRWHTMPS